MHLARGLTTLNTKKRKVKKLTEGQRNKYEIQWRQHNKEMRKKHLHEHQFEKLDDYIAYCRGTYKPKKKTETVMNTAEATASLQAAQVVLRGQEGRPEPWEPPGGPMRRRRQTG